MPPAACYVPSRCYPEAMFVGPTAALRLRGPDSRCWTCSPMDVRLVLEKGRARVRELRLRREETIVGRQKGSDLRIPSSEVSRRHCILSTQRGYLTVEDLDSANGTFLNGQQIKGKKVVRPGDRVRIGPLTFVVEYQLTQAAIDQLLAG